MVWQAYAIDISRSTGGTDRNKRRYLITAVNKATLLGWYSAICAESPNSKPIEMIGTCMRWFTYDDNALKLMESTYSYVPQYNGLVVVTRLVDGDGCKGVGWGSLQGKKEDSYGEDFARKGLPSYQDVVKG